MTQTRTLVEFLAQLDAHSLPAHVVERAKVHILDTIGVAIGGSCTTHARQAVATIQALGVSGNNTVIASSWRTNVLEAAFLNGVMAHSIDFDDAHKFVHAGAAVVPCALAFAETQKASPQDFLLAVVAGYEASVRVSLAGGPSHRARGFHPTGTCNVIGAAIAAGLLIGLDANGLVSAVGIAASQAAGLTQYRIDGAPTKHLHAGFAARAGGFAALLAQQGLRGPEASIEGEVGFLKAFADQGNVAALVSGLGETFAIATTDIKPFPSCRQTHAPIDLILRLLSDNNLSHEQIEAVELSTYHYIDKPWHTATTAPGSSLEGMLNIPYCLASAAIHGRLTLDNFSNAALEDSRVHKLMAKTSIQFDDALTSRWPSERGAVLTLRTDSETLSARATNPRGGVDQPVEWPEELVKFAGLAETVLGAGNSARIVDAIDALDTSESIVDLVEPLSQPIDPGRATGSQ